MAIFSYARSGHMLILAGFVASACVYIFFLEPWGHDTWFHLQRLQDIDNQLGRGQLRAYLAGNAAQGKGLPVWIYYSQWIYWPAVALRSLGASPLVSLKIIYCIFLAICCVGVYRLLRLDATDEAAAFGTLLFVTSNYVIGEVFQRSAYAEFMSVALLPLLLVALHHVLLFDDRRAWTGLVLLAALMVLFHPLSFMNAAYALAAFAAYSVIRWEVPYRRLLGAVPPLALALGLTAFYWLPAVVETRYVLGADGVPTPLQETFLSIPRYFKFSSVLSLGAVLTFLGLCVSGAMALGRGRSTGGHVRASWPLIAGVAVCVLLTLRVSEPLYTSLPLLASNLWVWRVLFPLTLLVTILVVVNLGALPHQLRRRFVLSGLAGLATLQAAAFVLWHTAADLSVRPLAVEEIDRALADEGGRLEGFGIDEYLPHPRAVPRPPVSCRGARTVPMVDGLDMRFPVLPDDAVTCVHVPRYWNVRYKASIDGRPTQVFADERGEMLLVPDGTAGLATVSFTRPAYATSSMYLSAASAILLLAGIARGRRVR